MGDDDGVTLETPVVTEQDDRRDQILRSALDVISERGYSDTRIADVAERVGVSPALVIYYFKTKDRLLSEAMRHAEDAWYVSSLKRLAEQNTAATKLQELVAMCTLPGQDDTGETWAIWLDLWAQSVRHPGVSKVRREFDERWRETIETIVKDGCASKEFECVDAQEFTWALSSMLDGFAIQIALSDPTVGAERAFTTTMNFCADHLRFEWSESSNRNGSGLSGAKLPGRSKA
jgi:AcrR family transcriptional regulator